jgi:hypothetical protein
MLANDSNAVSPHACEARRGCMRSAFRTRGRRGHLAHGRGARTAPLVSPG